MKVLCTVNNLNAFADKKVLARLKKNIFLSGEDLKFEVGREYTVYGMTFWDGSPWYYLCIEDYDNYPVPCAADFFKISDDRLSSYWKLSIDNRDPGDVLTSLLFSEWAQDNPSFYERLLDDYPDAIELFMKYRRLMEQEYT